LKGNNYYGQLGLGHNSHQLEFQILRNLPFGSQKINSLVCGPYVTSVITEDRRVWVCGNNWNGMLGLGDDIDRYTFTRLLVGDFDQNCSLIAIGSHHLVVVLSM
jgi:alpha-tubulin suppressor-like RCC1 family protein